ncbi:Hypothetical protein HVR_LOCUS641 [uncultured virus]|nr:Hypothetical protein HVR_LOCUS641 [uncultured virus]
MDNVPPYGKKQDNITSGRRNELPVITRRKAKGFAITFNNQVNFNPNHNISE